MRRRNKQVNIVDILWMLVMLVSLIASIVDRLERRRGQPVASDAAQSEPQLRGLVSRQHERDSRWEIFVPDIPGRTWRVRR
jgi:hypothetical protein